MNSDRLATVVRIRRLQERIARRDVMRDRRISSERERGEAVARQRVETASQHAPSSVSGFVAHRRMLESGVREVDAAGEAVIEAHGAVAESLAGWTTAAQRLDGVERLEERVVAADEAERERVEFAELDDLVVMRWDRD